MGASSAFALDCANVSRPAPAEPAQPLFVIQSPEGPVTIYAVQGNWWFRSDDGNFADGYWDFVPPGALVNNGVPVQLVQQTGLPASAVNGNYQAGTGFGLLDNAQAPCNPNRQTTQGIQAGSVRCGG